MKILLPGACCDYPHSGRSWVWRIELHTRRWRTGLALTPGSRYARWDRAVWCYWTRKRHIPAEESP